jgi:photosystem II stability/assembly factor-like uncharacterized protein
LGVGALTGCTSSGSGSSTGGIFKSDDGGRSFEPHNIIDEDSTIGRSDVLSIAVDPSNNDVIYIGTAKDDFFISVDGADTWTKGAAQLIGIRNIVVNPFNTQTIYMSGMYDGRGSVVRSVNGGKEWKRVYVEPQDGTNITAVVVSPINGDMIYIGTSGGTIARTLNAGDSWENLYHAQQSVNELLIDAGDINTLYALIDGRDVVKSRDDGVTFESVRDLERDYETEKLYEGTLYSMTVSPSVSGVVIVGTDKGVFRSENYGQSWMPVDVIASTIGIPIHAIEINPHNSNQLVYAAAKAVYTSINDSWAITDTTSNRTVDVIAHDPVNSNVVYLGLKKVK